MHFLTIAGYKFVSLNDTVILRTRLREQCDSLSLKGTILLSTEGINISLVGAPENIQSFKQQLNDDARLSHIHFHETISTFQTFKRLKVKLKKEIITFRQPDIHPID